MKDLAQYPIYLPFGSTVSPYSTSMPHHGSDIACPIGTPIIVNGTQLGLVGSTGLSTGPHCHIDKNKQLWAATGYVNPRDWNTITGEVIAAGDYGTAGLTVVVQADNGYFYRFLHMSKITTSVGQKVGDMYLGKTAKQWHDLYKKEVVNKTTWRARYRNTYDKVKAALGVRK